MRVRLSLTFTLSILLLFFIYKINKISYLQLCALDHIKLNKIFKNRYFASKIFFHFVIFLNLIILL